MQAPRGSDPQRWVIRTQLRVCPQGLIPHTSALRSLASGGMVCNCLVSLHLFCPPSLLEPVFKLQNSIFSFNRTDSWGYTHDKSPQDLCNPQQHHKEGPCQAVGTDKITAHLLS